MLDYLITELAAKITERCALIVGVDTEPFTLKVAILKDDRTQDEIDEIAREIKVIAVSYLALYLGVTLNLTVRYKSVSLDEMLQLKEQLDKGELLW